MRILVTGGAGFLGSNLCSRLVKNRSNHIICLDNLETGYLQNIVELTALQNFEFIWHDIVNPIELEVDQIYNAACPASPFVYQADPVHTMKTSVIGILNMLDLAQRNNAILLQFSTSEVYGDALVHPQKENYWGNVNPDGIRSCYDEGKRAAETLCFDYYRKYDAKIKVVRIFNTYGPKMNPFDGRVISNFINQALRGEDITIYGDGSQTRSFCFVDDLIDGIVRMMETSDSVTGPVNLGNPEEITILQLATEILSKVPNGSKVVFKVLPRDDPKQRRPDITLASKLLGWEPHVPLLEGLDRQIDYFRSLCTEK